MITAIDASVLLAVFLPDDQHGETSRDRLRLAYDAGAVIICDVVYAELAAAFGSRKALDRALATINVSRSPIDGDIAFEAGLRWKRYRAAGGSRTRILADFLIGAHAVSAAETLLTRDRGFFRTYFPEL